MITFVTIVRKEGDATAAAEELKINQPSMSKRLAFLQHAGRILRKPWLERSGKSWQLTPEGKRVLPAVEELVHRYRLLTGSIDEQRPEVMVGCGPSTASGFVREAVKLYRKRRPEGTFRITSSPAVTRVEGVANGSLDIACVRMASAEVLEIGKRPLYIQDLYDDPLVAVASTTFPEVDELSALTDKSFTPKVLHRFPLLLPEPTSDLRHDFDRRCREAGVYDRLKITVEAGPWSTVMQYVRDGLGVGVVPRSIAQAESAFVSRALPAKLSPTNTIRVVCRTKAGSDDLDLTAAGLEFLTALRDAARQQSRV